MSEEVWKEYDKTVQHWRPQFGNERHIQARDAIADINRRMPTYENLRENYASRQLGKDHKVSSKRLDAAYDEITKLKRLVLSLIKGV
jgi:hypothetical protein